MPGRVWSTRVNRQEYGMCEEELGELRHHWGDAYQIEKTGPCTWLAARRDGKGAVHANSADGLFAAISADYLKQPVPREQS